jgi:hypothetical protein
VGTPAGQRNGTYNAKNFIPVRFHGPLAMLTGLAPMPASNESLIWQTA